MSGIFGERPDLQVERERPASGDNRLEGGCFKGLVIVLACFCLLAAAAAIMIPSLLRSAITSNEASAIATMRTINTAQQQYKTGEPGSRYGTLATLSGIGNPAYLDTVVGSGTKSGYTYVCTVGPDGRSYSVRAGPVTPARGSRYFFTNSGAVIFHATNPNVDQNSSPID